MGGMDTEMERDLISIMKEKQTISRKNKKKVLMRQQPSAIKRSNTNLRKDEKAEKVVSE